MGPASTASPLNWITADAPIIAREQRLDRSGNREDTFMQRTRKNFSRRTFHCHAGVSTAAFLSPHILLGESTRPTANKYVDVHVHLGQPWNQRGPLTPEMLLRWMDAHEIAQAVVLSLISPESWFYPITPQWVLEQTKPFRDRLIPFCSVDPRSVNLGGYRGFLDILKRYQDAGAQGRRPARPGSLGRRSQNRPAHRPANYRTDR